MGVNKVVRLVGENQTELRRLNLRAEGLIEAYSCAQLVRDPEEALGATLAKIARGESRACIIVETSGEIPDEVEAAQTRISSVVAGFQKIEFRIDNDGPVWLRIGMTWYPGWQAWIDGHKTPIYHGDYLFSAIHAPAGSHQLVFSYRPLSLSVGVGATGAGGALLLLVGIWLPKKTARLDERS
jgi:hypothetical protein